MDGPSIERGHNHNIVSRYRKGDIIAILYYSLEMGEVGAILSSQLKERGLIIKKTHWIGL